jgi:hypothetical protein
MVEKFEEKNSLVLGGLKDYKSKNLLHVTYPLSPGTARRRVAPTPSSATSTWSWKFNVKCFVTKNPQVTV